MLSDVVGGLSFRGVTLEGSCKGPSESPDRKEGEGDGGGQGEREKQTSRVLRGRGRERGRGGGLVKEPYTCERLNCVTGGYTQLSVVHTALSIDFTNPEVQYILHRFSHYIMYYRGACYILYNFAIFLSD